MRQGKDSMALRGVNNGWPKRVVATPRVALAACPPVFRTLTFVALLIGLCAWSAVAADRLPNIVLIMADDLGYGELGAYGQEKIRTPHIDQLAREGMKFTQHYTGAPVCAPARCVLMTGKHTGHAFIRNNREARPIGQQPIPADEITIARLLKDRGYATAAVGKWGLGPPGSTGDPNHHGFDLFFGANCQRNAHSYYPAYLWRNLEKVDLSEPNRGGIRGHYRGRLPDAAPERFEQFKGEAYSPDLMLDAALSFIRAHKDQPFFLYYPSLSPHVALQIPDEELEPYLKLGWDDPPYLGGGGYLPHRTPRAAYAAMISRLDREVGTIHALVKELGLDDDTIILFTSDNGPTHLDQVDVGFFDSAGGLRGLKGSVYEGGIRIPMIARWPGRIKPGTVTDHPSYFPDVMPTLMDLIGKLDEMPDDRDGISFAPTLLGRSNEQRTHDAMIWEFQGYGGQQAVRIGDWKGVRQNIREGNLTIELYNLATDRAETTDVAADHPALVKRMERIMAEERTVSEVFGMEALDK